jgi:hypothetical protein
MAEFTDVLKAAEHFGTGKVGSARSIPEWSIVRLADGRVGALAKHTSNGKPSVILSFGETSYGVEIAKSAQLEIVAFPVELARAYLERQTKGDRHAEDAGTE